MFEKTVREIRYWFCVAFSEDFSAEDEQASALKASVEQSRDLLGHDWLSTLTRSRSRSHSGQQPQKHSDVKDGERKSLQEDAKVQESIVEKKHEEVDTEGKEAEKAVDQPETHNPNDTAGALNMLHISG